jgi:WD40 repeat protein
VADVFISYSRRDSDFVKRLHQALADRGRDVWVDWEDIPPASEWRDELHEGIDDSKAVIFVMSPRSLGSDECHLELTRAIDNGKRIVPVVWEDPDGVKVPEALANRNWVFLRVDDDFDRGVSQVESALDADPAWVRTHTRLLNRAQEWESGGRSRALVLRGTDLHSAEEALAGWHEGTEPAPTPLQREYLQASRHAASQRLRGLVAGLAVALVISIGLGVFALIQRSKAVDREHSAQSRQIAVAGILQLDNDPELSALLAMEALKRARTPEAEDALRRAVARIQVRGQFDAGRKGVVSAVASPSENEVLTADDDGSVELWDPHTERVSQRLPDHPGGIATASFSRDGRFVVTGGRKDGVVRVWDVARRRAARTIHTGKGDVEAWLSSDGGRVVASDPQGVLRTFDVRTGRPGPTLPNPGFLAAVGIDRSGDRLVAMHRDSAQAWDTRTGRQLAPPVPLPSEPTAGAIAPDGSFAVILGSGHVAWIWDLRTGRLTHTLHHDGRPLAVDVSPNSRMIATGDGGNQIRLWSPGTGHLLEVLRGHGDSVYGVEFSSDGRRILSRASDQTARVWEVSTGEQLSVLRSPNQDFTTAAFAPRGGHVLTGGPDGTVRIWEAAPGRTVGYLPRPVYPYPVSFSPDGRYLASAGADDTVGLINGATGRHGPGFDTSRRNGLTAATPADLEFAPRGLSLALADGVVADVLSVKGGAPVSVQHDKDVTDVSWSNDARRLASSDYAGVARVTDARTGRDLVSPIHAGQGQLMWAVLSGDGRRLVTGGLHSVRMWNVGTGGPIGTPLKLDGTIRDVALSPDGLTVAEGDDQGFARLWRPGATAKPRKLEHNAGVNRVRFSRDGRRLLTASDDGTVRLWSVPSGRSLAVLRGHTDEVFDADLSPDGRFIVSASRDDTVRLWDARNLRQLGEVAQFDAPAQRARFSPDGRSIAAIPSRGLAAEYACDACAPLDELISRARHLVRRPLTRAERRRYLP